MRTVILAVLLVAATATPALAETRGFPVSGFDRVRSTGPFDVRVHTGRQPGVHADGPREMLDRLRVEVRGGELVIGTTPGSWFSGWNMGWGKRTRTVVDVTVPMVSAVSLSGPGDVSVDRVRARAFAAALSGPGDMTIGAVEAGEIDLTLSGPGDITVGGRAGRARISLSGPGDIRAQKLTVDDATIRLSGPGDIAITALRSADGHASGPGDVRVTGGARCSIAKSGPGDVHCG